MKAIVLCDRCLGDIMGSMWETTLVDAKCNNCTAAFAALLVPCCARPYAQPQHLHDLTMLRCFWSGSPV